MRIQSYGTVSYIPDMVGSDKSSKISPMKWLYYAGLAGTALAVGPQMANINVGFITNYLADLAGPVWMYGAMRHRLTLLRHVYLPTPSPALAAGFIFLIGTAWEICQAFDLSGTILSITRGRFDPYDILAYAVSLTACFLIDTFLFNQSQTNGVNTPQHVESDAK